MDMLTIERIRSIVQTPFGIMTHRKIAQGIFLTTDLICVHYYLMRCMGLRVISGKNKINKQSLNSS